MGIILLLFYEDQGSCYAAYGPWLFAVIVSPIKNVANNDGNF